MWEVHAREGAGAEVVCTLSCGWPLAGFSAEVGWRGMLCVKKRKKGRHTSFVLLLVPCAIAPYVLRLLVLLLLPAEHLVEEAELEG
jgi:hypothetical protein